MIKRGRTGAYVNNRYADSMMKDVPVLEVSFTRLRSILD